MNKDFFYYLNKEQKEFLGIIPNHWNSKWQKGWGILKPERLGGGIYIWSMHRDKDMGFMKR